MTRKITNTGCPVYKTVCKRIYYKELEPRQIITLCYSVDKTEETQAYRNIKNINITRTNTRKNG